MVAYAAVPGAAVAAGEPVAPLDVLIDVAEGFVAFARATGRRASFFATEGRLAASPMLQRRLLGEQPVWDPRCWDAQWRTHRSLREQGRRARAKGVAIMPLSPATVARPEIHQAITTLVARWRATRSMPPLRFLVEVDLISGAEQRRTWLAHCDGVLVAVLSLAPVPARAGWLFEHLLRDPDAPNGTAEMLVDHAMRTLAAEEVSWVTLGLAPLHGPVDGWLQRARRWSAPLFNFRGLAAWKNKLRPQQWEPIYLAWPHTEPGWRAMLDGLRAFAGEPLWRFGARTVLRGPAVVLRALEWLLCVWTILLALVPTAAWFPSVAVHAAWLLFDGLLWLALRQLRLWTALREHDYRRPRARQRAARLATLLAGAITADALVTLVQALLWNAPRATSVISHMVMMVAIVGPLLTASILWGTAHRLRVLAAPPPTVDVSLA